MPRHTIFHIFYVTGTPHPTNSKHVRDSSMCGFSALPPHYTPSAKVGRYQEENTHTHTQGGAQGSEECGVDLLPTNFLPAFFFSPFLCQKYIPAFLQSTYVLNYPMGRPPTTAKPKTGVRATTRDTQQLTLYTPPAISFYPQSLG